MFIVVAGSKGGVGATTLAAGLCQAAEIHVQPVDLTGTGDLAHEMDKQPVLLDDLVHVPDYALDRAVQLVRSRGGVLVLSETIRVLHIQRVARILDMLEAYTNLVVDTGMFWSPAILGLTSAIVLVATPDPRSLLRADKFVQAQNGVADRIVPVINMVRHGDDVSSTDFTALPDAGYPPLRNESWQGAVGGVAVMAGLATQTQPASPVPQRRRQSFSFKRLIPSFKLVD